MPVINGLADKGHPCQILADLLTMREALGGWARKVVAWVGDGNNMANSWLEAAGLLGFELRVAYAEGYEPDHATYEWAAARTRVLVTELPEEAVAGAHVINTDVWTSMGDEGERRPCLAFTGYAVDGKLMAQARPDAIFLHCLPAHRGEEVTEAMPRGPQSRVFDQAENRLHAQKALMATLMG